VLDVAERLPEVLDHREEPVTFRSCLCRVGESSLEVELERVEVVGIRAVFDELPSQQAPFLLEGLSKSGDVFLIQGILPMGSYRPLRAPWLPERWARGCEVR
jgi:hypothetical protein